MTPVVLCLLSLVAAVLWVLYSTMFGIRSFFTALGKNTLPTVKILLVVGAACLGFNFLIIVFTDASIIGDFLRELWSNIGFGGLIIIFIVGGVFIGIGQFILPIILFLFETVGAIICYLALGIVSIFIWIFTFLEEHFGKWYKAILNQINRRVQKSQGGSR